MRPQCSPLGCGLRDLQGAIRPKRCSSSFAIKTFRRRVRLGPAADQATDLVERAGGMLIAAPIEIVQLNGESKVEAQLLYPPVRAEQRARTSVPRKF